MQTIDALVSRIFPTRRDSKRSLPAAPALFVATATDGIPLPAVDFGHEFAIACALLIALVCAGAVAIAIGVKFDAGDDAEHAP
jgi:hypothetical protein